MSASHVVSKCSVPEQKLSLKGSFPTRLLLFEKWKHGTEKEGSLPPLTASQAFNTGVTNNSFMTSGGFVKNKYFYPLGNSQEAEEIMEVVTSLFVGRDTTEGT